jgi:hypothetical protein
VAGCLSEEARQARLQLLSQTTPAHHTAQDDIEQHKVQDDVGHTSLHDQQTAIQRRNEALLQVSKGKSAGLGGVLDAAMKQMLRAEAAEVKLRRQAELSKGASVKIVYKSLRWVMLRVSLLRMDSPASRSWLEGAVSFAQEYPCVQT